MSLARFPVGTEVMVVGGPDLGLVPNRYQVAGVHYSKGWVLSLWHVETGQHRYVRESHAERAPIINNPKEQE